MPVAAQGRGCGETGGYHAQHALGLRVDHGHSAGHEVVEFDIDDVGTVRRRRKRQRLEADRGVRGQFGVGAGQANERRAKSQRGMGQDPGYSHRVLP
ncbi:hypothetical protein D3C85_1233710 [compost metagenome]